MRKYRVPSRLYLKVGDHVVLKRGPALGRRPQRRRMGVSSAFRKGRVVWEIVGVTVIYGHETMFILNSGSKGSQMRMEARASELVLLNDVHERPKCTVRTHKGGRASVGCWEITHPWYGKVLAVRAKKDEKFLEHLKKFIRYEDRRWCRGSRLWYISLRLRPVVEALLRRYFPKEKEE